MTWIIWIVIGLIVLAAIGGATLFFFGGKTDVNQMGLHIESLLKGTYGNPARLRLTHFHSDLAIELIHADLDEQPKTALIFHRSICPGDEFERAERILTEHGIEHAVLEPLGDSSKKLIVECEHVRKAVTAATYIFMDGCRLPHTARLRVTTTPLTEQTDMEEVQQLLKLATE